MVSHQQISDTSLSPGAVSERRLACIMARQVHPGPGQPVRTPEDSVVVRTGQQV